MTTCNFRLVTSVATTALLILTTSLPMLAANKTVPGEKWQQNITMSMEGISMPLGNSEICAPVGKATELMKPDKNCKVSNVRQAGNKTSADIKCTGKDAMEGSVELIAEGNRTHGTARMRSGDGEMTMKMESQKMGACQALDTDALVVDAEKTSAAATKAAADAVVRNCANAADELKRNPGTAGAQALSFARAGGPCVSKPTNANFCAAVQTPAGFSSLQQVEGAMSGIMNNSLAACNLGQGKSAVDALRARLIVSAEANGDSGFLEANAPARLKEIARAQCVLKGEMWGGRSAKWDTFCDSNFAEAARGR
jgi:hypothetical protein